MNASIPAMASEFGSYYIAKGVDSLWSTITGFPKSGFYDVESLAAQSKETPSELMKAEYEQLSASVQDAHFASLSGMEELGSVQFLVREAARQSAALLGYKEWQKIEPKLLQALAKRYESSLPKKQLDKDIEAITRLVQLGREGKPINAEDRILVVKMKAKANHSHADVVKAFEEVEPMMGKERPFSWEVSSTSYPNEPEHSEYPLSDHWRVRLLNLADAYFKSITQ